MTQVTDSQPTVAAQAGGPLAGIRVLEIGRYIAAPYAGRLLAEQGTDVVKVEDPEPGDPMRSWEGGARPYSPQFAAYNYRKRGITLNLKEDQGREALRRLVRDADVLPENFRPGVMARLGLSPEQLREVNPRLVHCSITGFGATGPYAVRPSYDSVIRKEPRMSRYAVNKLMRRVNMDPDALAAYRSGAPTYVAAFAKAQHRAGQQGLTAEETAALAAKDYAALYALGAHPYLLWSFTEAVHVRAELVESFRVAAARVGNPDCTTTPLRAGREADR